MTEMSSSDDEAALTQTSQLRAAGPLLKRFWQWWKPHIRHVWVVMGIQLIATPVAIVIPLVVRKVVDDTMMQEDASSLLIWAGLLVLLALVTAGLAYLAGSWLIKFRVKVVRDIRLALFRHMQELSTSYHARHETGFMMSRQIDDVHNLETVMADAMLRVSIAALRAVAYGIMLFYIEWRMASGGLLLAGLMVVITHYSSPYLRRLARISLERRTEVSAATHQGLSGHPLIQATGSETLEAIRFAKTLHESIRADVRRDIWTLAYRQVYAIISGTGPALIVLAGIALVVTSDFTIGGLFAFFMYLGRLLLLVANVVGFNAKLQGSLASLGRIFEVLDAVPEIASPPGGGRRIEVGGALRFEDVSFAYEEDRLVLQHIDLDIPPRSRVALVGHSGAGKSTLASMVPRLFDPIEGRVLVDGVDLRELDVQHYRKQVGFVPQDVFLFDRTVAENIAIGRREATTQEIREAAEAANAMEFIDELPLGLDTPIGERGVRLSGGQRQRLAIARELLRDPRILILDEATSAVDSHSEALIQEALEHLFEGRTSLVIAHRLSTIIGSDLILVLEGGEIVERGSHEELLLLEGRYSGLYHRQFTTPEIRTA